MSLQVLAALVVSAVVVLALPRQAARRADLARRSRSPKHRQENR